MLRMWNAVFSLSSVAWILLSVPLYSQSISPPPFLFKDRVDSTDAGKVFESDICPGPVMTFDSARSKFPKGGTSAGIGTFRHFLRVRTCTKLTDCSDWTYSEHPYESGSVFLKLNEGGIYLQANSSLNRQSDTFMSLNCTGIGAEHLKCDKAFVYYHNPVNPNYTPGILNFGPQDLAYNGYLAEQCLYLRASHWSWLDPRISQWQEQETVIMGNVRDNKVKRE